MVGLKAASVSEQSAPLAAGQRAEESRHGSFLFLIALFAFFLVRSSSVVPTQPTFAICRLPLPDSRISEAEKCLDMKFRYEKKGQCRGAPFLYPTTAMGKRCGMNQKLPNDAPASELAEKLPKACAAN